METTNSSDLIFSTLEDEIIRLKIKPGEQLSEGALCERFGVSRTPMRSALQRLEENGLVAIVPYKGIEVTLLDYGIVDQIIYQRVAVESMVVRDFIKICTPLMIEKIRYLVRSSKVLLEGVFESGQFYDLDSEMHGVWFRETKKEYLWECIQKAQCNYSRFRMLDITENHDCEAILAEHEELLDILERRDLDAVQDFFFRHLYGGVKRLGERIYGDLSGYFTQGQ